MDSNRPTSAAAVMRAVEPFLRGIIASYGGCEEVTMPLRQHASILIVQMTFAVLDALQPERDNLDVAEGVGMLVTGWFAELPPAVVLPKKRIRGRRRQA